MRRSQPHEEPWKVFQAEGTAHAKTLRWERA